MKIRSDFVTNSSSSSFTLTLNITMSDGNEISWEGTACEEGGAEYYDISALKSPRELAHASSIKELIKLLNSSIRDGYWDEEEKGKSLQVGRSLSSELLQYDIDDISKIEISGDESNYLNYYRKFVYNTETDEYTLEQEGNSFEKNGGSGGDLYFNDLQFLTENSDSIYDDFPVIIPIEGTGYEGRNDRLEKVKTGDSLKLKTDWNSPYYSPVAIEVFNNKNGSLGYLKDSYQDNFPPVRLKTHDI